MYMVDIKLVAKNKKEKIIGIPNTCREDIQSRYRDRIWLRKMSKLNRKRRTANDRGNRIMKSKKHQNARRKVFRNIGSGNHQTSGVNQTHVFGAPLQLLGRTSVGRGVNWAVTVGCASALIISLLLGGASPRL